MFFRKFWAPLAASILIAIPIQVEAEPDAARVPQSPDAARITILYDAFGKASEMRKDWGFAAYVEYGGKRILFDTGNNNEIFAHNVQAKGIDLAKLDFAVISHRHGDHSSGVSHLLKINPSVKIYVPQRIVTRAASGLCGVRVASDSA